MIKMSGQVIYFCIYIYLQGFLNNYATECKTYDELTKVLGTDESLLANDPGPEIRESSKVASRKSNDEK